MKRSRRGFPLCFRVSRKMPTNDERTHHVLVFVPRRYAGMSTKTTTTVAAGAAAALSLAVLYKTLRKGSSSSSSCANANNTYLLAGDIGGTNSRLSLYDPHHCEPSGSADPPAPLYTNTFRNNEALQHGDGDLTFALDVILPFLTECFEDKGIPERSHIVACFAVAGPVNQNRAQMTNIGGDHTPDVGAPKQILVIDGSVIESATKSHLAKVMKCRIVNDFVGQGLGPKFASVPAPDLASAS